MFRFKEFPVYKESLALTKEVRLLTKQFPPEELYGLSSQLIRATDSILLNIAEGSNRYSDRDFSRFLNQASSSVSEVVASLDIALSNNLISKGNYQRLIDETGNIYKQIMAFSSKVRRDSKVN